MHGLAIPLTLAIAGAILIGWWNPPAHVAFLAVMALGGSPAPWCTPSAGP